MIWYIWLIALLVAVIVNFFLLLFMESSSGSPLSGPLWVLLLFIFDIFVAAASYGLSYLWRPFILGCLMFPAFFVMFIGLFIAMSLSERISIMWYKAQLWAADRRKKGV